MNHPVWSPTPYRRSTQDEVADVRGYGRFRVRPIKATGGALAFEVTQNGERIGLLHDSATDAKCAVNRVVNPDHVVDPWRRDRPYPQSDRA